MMVWSFGGTSQFGSESLGLGRFRGCGFKEASV